MPKDSRPLCFSSSRKEFARWSASASFFSDRAAKATHTLQPSSAIRGLKPS